MLENQEKRKQILVFITTNYDEDTFEAVCAQLQREQLTVSIAGLTTAVIYGCYGTEQQPQVALSALLKGASTLSTPDAVLLAGGVQCINQLFADPRFHDFLAHCIALGKPIGICRPFPYEWVASSKLFQAHQVQLQNRESHAQFVERFIRTIL